MKNQYELNEIVTFNGGDYFKTLSVIRDLENKGLIKKVASDDVWMVIRKDYFKEEYLIFSS